jgi:GNAT superfamily N-acetyltransferase
MVQTAPMANAADPASPDNARKESRAATAGDEPPQSQRVVVRRLLPSDSVPEITRLLHRAYRKQTEMGMRPLAGRQSDDVTRERISKGECYVAVIEEPRPSGLKHDRIVGTILFQEPAWGTGPEWFERRDVANFSQFAVDPDLQGKGIGIMLMDICEQRARETGAAELALSAAGPDTDLLRFYEKRGYRFIQPFQWGPTNYISHILSKKL